MDRGVVLVFDEVAVGKKRGTRDGMSLEEVKHITEVGNSTSVEARYENLEIGVEQPRIFTCNGSSPKEWHFRLPNNALTTMSSDERKALPLTPKRCSREFVSHMYNQVWCLLRSGANLKQAGAHQRPVHEI